VTDEHLSPDRLVASDRTPEEAAHLQSCARCRTAEQEARTARVRSQHTLAGVLSRIQGGERGTDPDLARQLDEAFMKNVPALRRLCRRELGGFPQSVVEEEVQEVLLQAWRKLPSYEPRLPFRVFLLEIARRKCANVRRKRRDVLTEDGFLEVGSEERGVIAQLAEEERNALIQQAAQNVLEQEEQELVVLRWVLDYPYDVIVEELGLPDTEAVRVGLQRCKRHMRKEIRRLLAGRGLGESFLRDPE